jgi:hypothetical protein
MKFSFKIATEPTIHMAIAITMLFCHRQLLLQYPLSLAIPPGDPTISIYCATVLALFLWLVLAIHCPVLNAAKMPTATTPPPPPLSTAKLKTT